ncbi:hypothetical protein EMIHUDRAFT_433910 [Emiliania huxleyi CCMP1516]|uniref:Uncharacterized protein n=2 Tax=Emiliania huxleyi TaxID=2903 RepID=A0A0D3KEI7_EMIH1|nr:hypothetical protein EMIHUDRAFT_433910 [Emiliania huxleyi CCMP1516]EOD34172.1 hypothetical protein EMIHUDRAFT_433910 [Emiliania huxleyi CCMP1516]|eukprot:XP_005786601.1 hypothetical protein EMIHUDRAFT_433910 [Emiliania huxleyi CCMP1516]
MRKRTIHAVAAASTPRLRHGASVGDLKRDDPRRGRGVTTCGSSKYPETDGYEAPERANFDLVPEMTCRSTSPAARIPRRAAGGRCTGQRLSGWPSRASSARQTGGARVATEPAACGGALWPMSEHVCRA